MAGTSMEMKKNRCRASILRNQFAVVAVSLLLQLHATELGAQLITTFAGDGEEGFSGDGGPATSAKLYPGNLQYFHLDFRVAVAANGDVYITDGGNHRIRKITRSNGTISTVVGTGSAGFSGDGGQATSAQLNAPSNIALDSVGDLFVLDKDNERVRKVDVSTGIITTVAGPAGLVEPWGIAVAPNDDVFVLDTRGSQDVKKIDASGTDNLITHVSIDGGCPWDMAIDASGTIYYGDPCRGKIGKIDGSLNTSVLISGLTEPAGLNYGADGYL